MQSKADLRNRYRRERQERYVPHTFEFLLEIPEVQQAATIASYYSFGFEPDTSALNRALINSGKKLLLPRIAGKELDWITWNGDENQLVKKGKFHEPIGDPNHEIQSIDLVIVPALRIDRDGNRLGQGGGYYDRALPNISGWKIALIHSDEISGEQLPTDPWDTKVDAAATPDLIFRFN